MSQKLKTAVVGASGYSGAELARILARHPHVEPPLLLRQPSPERPGGKAAGTDTLPLAGSNGDHAIEGFSWSALKSAQVQLLFLATPHEVSRALVPEVLARGLRAIDLSGAWRLKQPHHRKVYGFH